MEPIRITPTHEKVISKTPNRAGGYLETVERFGVDQYGHEWHSFHTRHISEPTDQLTKDDDSGQRKQDNAQP